MPLDSRRRSTPRVARVAKDRANVTPLFEPAGAVKLPRTRATGAVVIGISGWRYPEWRGGSFYPRGLRQADELGFAASHFASIELNGSFYSLQRPALYECWRDGTPRDFVFSVKGSRYITHLLRLRNVEIPLANFFASGPLCLGPKLGPILWQFPPQLAFDGRFEEFFGLLPRDTLAASELARRHDRRVPVAAFATERRPLRHAVEVRHPSFVTPEFIALLRRERIALVVADTARLFPYIEDVTADFVYVRLHGDEEIYRSGYSAQAIERWADRVHAWSRGGAPTNAVLASQVAPPRRATRDVFVYFDNDVKAHAPFDALALARAVAERAGIGPLPALPSRPAGVVAERPAVRRASAAPVRAAAPRPWRRRA